jgi:hypothetical protein
MKIAVVGTGYVGLVSGTCFAETGNSVTCVDIDQAKVEKLQSGKITIYEPGLENLFHRNVTNGRLKFTTNLEEGIKDAKTPISPPSGPSQWLFQKAPAKSKFLAPKSKFLAPSQSLRWRSTSSRHL